MVAAARQATLAVRQHRGYCSGEFTAMASPCRFLSRARRSTARRQLEAVANEAWRIEEKFSRYLRGNIVDRINSADGDTVEVDGETARLLDFSTTLYTLSDGLFDITSGVLREAWNFDGSDRLPRDSDVQRILQRVGWHKVRWDPPRLAMAPGMQLDFGGVAKEYAVDRAAALAAALDDAPCLVNFGGDLAAAGAAEGEPWMVGIESLHPGAATPFKRIRLARGGLATSGDARRYLLKDGARLGHILDPRTGWPVAGAPGSVTVAADTCTAAGMLSTLAMLEGAGAERFLERQGVRSWCIRPEAPESAAAAR
jgi:thiamine biosynthesis lipoprotein